MAEQESNSSSGFNQLNLGQKLRLAFGITALFALLAGLWIWEQTPDYRVLYSNLSYRDSGAIIESLQQMNIPYKFAEGGGTLLVPSNMVYEARLKLATQGITKGGTELSARNATVVDQNGTLLSAGHGSDSNEGLDANQLKYVQQIERRYTDRINTLLIPILGANNVRAQVSADVDFSRTEQTSEIYKPNQSPETKVIRSQHSSVSTSNSGSGSAPGNQITATPGKGTSKGQTGANNAGPYSHQRESTVSYEIDRTVSHTVLPVGSIKRLFVAVVINGNRKVTDANGKVSLKPFSDIEKEQIDNLVKDATGYDQNRGDSLNVQIAPFTENESVEETSSWKQSYAVELTKDVIKYSLIATAVWFLVFSVITPSFHILIAALSKPGRVKTTQDARDNIGAQFSAAAPYEQNLQVARQIAQQEPKIVASVIKEWLKK